MSLQAPLIGFSGIRWLQYQAEVDALRDIVLAAGARSYLEVGAHLGDTWHYIGRVMPRGSKLVAIDWPGKTAGMPESGAYLQRAARDLAKQHGHRTTVHFGDSRELDMVRRIYELGPFDVVFIDGDHSLEGCAADWRNYGAMGRIVAFHDIAQVSRPRTCMVYEVYKDACHGRRHQELVHNDKGHRGIGVVWRDGEQILGRGAVNDHFDGETAA